MDRLLKDVMGLDDDDLLVKALDSAGIKTVPDLLTLTDEQIDNLTYLDPVGGDEQLPPLGQQEQAQDPTLLELPPSAGTG